MHVIWGFPLQFMLEEHSFMQLLASVDARNMNVPPTHTQELKSRPFLRETVLPCTPKASRGLLFLLHSKSSSWH